MYLGLRDEHADALTEPVTRIVELARDAVGAMARAFSDELDRFGQKPGAFFIHGPMVGGCVWARSLPRPGWRSDGG